MISQERSLHFRLVVLIVFYTGSMSVTLVGKFHLDEGSGFLWFSLVSAFPAIQSIALSAFEGISRLFRYPVENCREVQKHPCVQWWLLLLAPGSGTK